MTVPKRTVAEWVTIANMNASKTIFLEGVTDSRLLETASDFVEHTDFRSADEISAEVESCPLSGGHKQKVISLAKEISAKSQFDNMRFLVDGDFANLVSIIDRSANLIETDYANLVSGCISRKWLNEVCFSTFGAKISPQIWQSLNDALSFCFLSRFFVAANNLGFRAPSPGKHIEIKNDLPFLNQNSYLGAYLGVHATSDKTKVTINEIVDLRNWLNSDIRHLINSHDFLDLVFTFLKKMKKISGSTSRDSVRNALFAALPKNLGDQPKIKTLIDWAVAK